jgi:phosphatidylserine/phosphatidylglycerophosphate/cardiolipin synthase-like enzyme
MRFTGCSAADLEAVADALSSGRLQMPPGEVAIGRLGVTAPVSLHADLLALAATGWRSDLAADLLRTLASERRASSIQSPAVDLVITGPDVQQQTRNTAVVVNQLFGEATASVLVVGFALYKGSVIFRRLAERLDQSQSLDVTLCLDISRRGNDTTRDSDLVDRFAERFVREEWPGTKLPKVFYDPRGLAMAPADRAVLHSKCIVVDQQTALVTSANPTLAAYTRNIELGLVIRDGEIAYRIADHFSSLVRKRVLKPLVLRCRDLGTT